MPKAIKIVISFFIGCGMLFASDQFYYYHGKKIDLKPLSSEQISQYSISPTVQYFSVNRNGKDIVVGVSNEIMVKFNSPVADKYRLESKYNLQYVKSLRKIHIYRAVSVLAALLSVQQITENEDVKYAQPTFLAELRKDKIANHMIETPDIVLDSIMSFANEDTTSSLDGTGSINFFKYFDTVFFNADTYSWHIYNKGGFSSYFYDTGTLIFKTSIADVDMNILEVWEKGFFGKGVNVAVIDTGFDMQHADLRFKDSYSVLRNNKDVTEVDLTSISHGTSTSGVITASAGNNYAVAGIAHRANLIALGGLFDVPPLDIYSKYIESMYKADDLGADVINCSFGTTGVYDAALEDVVTEVATTGRNGKGVIIVYSSGNDGVSLPSEDTYLDVVMNVGAIEATGQRTQYSNYGKTLDIVAPTHFLSLDLVGANGADPADTMLVSGTSFSAPAVSAVIALILEANPDLTREQVFDIVYSTAKKVGTGSLTDGFSYTYSLNIVGVTDPFNQIYTRNDEVGYGLIDADAAVTKALSLVVPTVPTTSLTALDIDALASGQWSLIGTPLQITDLSIFNNVSIVWYYENTTSSWKAYSPDVSYAAEISAGGFPIITIPANSGIWVLK